MNETLTVFERDEFYWIQYKEPPYSFDIAEYMGDGFYTTGSDVFWSNNKGYSSFWGDRFIVYSHIPKPKG